MHKINVFLQARMSSKRFPKKVLKSILHRPMLDLQIERIKRTSGVSNIIVLTSSQSSDDILAEYCNENNISCYRGSLNNVLKRFYDASKEYVADHYIRLTADCPLLCPDILERLIRLHRSNDYDYTSNIINRTYPDGMDCEIFKTNLLDDIFASNTTLQEQEHVTLYVKNNPRKFKIGELCDSIDRSKIRLTVDYESDYNIIKKIFESLYPENSAFLFQDIISLLETMNNNS